MAGVGLDTYRKLSEFILNQHYDGFPQPEHAITQRHIAERIAMKIAKYAKINAFESGQSGDTAYANDQFVSVFYSLPLLTDSVTSEKYIDLPAMPAGLPKNTEIVQVSFTGSPNAQVIPMQQKDAFMESLLPPLPPSLVLYKIENGNIVFPNLPKIINSPVNLKMIGTVPGDMLLDSILNIPKDYEDDIVLTILQELAQEYGNPPKIIEKGEPN